MGFFFFNDTATTEIYTLPLHDALPIWFHARAGLRRQVGPPARREGGHGDPGGGAGLSRRRDRPLRRHHHRRARDRKSTRLNSSHANISYAVFCLKKKTHTTHTVYPILT